MLRIYIYIYIYIYDISSLRVNATSFKNVYSGEHSWLPSLLDVREMHRAAGPRPGPGPGINFTGPREVLLEVVILVF